LYYFSKIGSHFEKVVQNIELQRVGGAPKDHPFSPPNINYQNMAVKIKGNIKNATLLLLNRNGMVP